MEFIKKNLVLQYPKTKQGKQEYIGYYFILAVVFGLLIAFYSVQEVTITEQSSTDGDGCTANDVTFNSVLGSVQNLPYNDGDCYNSIYKVVNESIYMNFLHQCFYDPTDSTSPYTHTSTWEASYYNGATVTVMTKVGFTAATQISQTDQQEYARCYQATPPGIIDYEDNICCTGTSSPGYCLPTYTGTSWNLANCPSTETIKPGQLLKNSPDGIFSLLTDAEKDTIISQYAVSFDNTVKGMCRFAPQSVTYTCDRKIKQSPISILVTCITLWTSIAAYVLSAFSMYYGPDPEEDASSPVVSAAVELKSSSTKPV
eukprot:jgi/Bigna1/145322/aug1.97_g20030